MKSFLIIPMGGSGKRFVDKGYKTYKAFLPVDKNINIFEGIISNFKKLDIEVIIIANFKALNNRYNKYLKKSNHHLIDIKSHKKGPVYSLFLAQKKLREIIKDNEQIFISYTDINWSWNINHVNHFVKNKKIVIFTHENFHPHLEINSKSDFCTTRKNLIKNISEKKTISKDYKKDQLAIGCYYINDYKLIENFFFKSKLLFKKKSELYLVSLIKHYLKSKIKIYPYKIKKFVHLGTPEQYSDFINWKNIIKSKNKKIMLNNFPTFMLAGGKGERVNTLNKKKPLLSFLGKPIYEYIFNKYNSKKKIIITNNNFIHSFDKKKYQLELIPKTNSMFNSIYAARNILQINNSFLLTSCDCFGSFNLAKIRKLCKSKIDLIFFAFNFSEMQKKLNNAHTQLITISNKLKDIRVKKKYKFGYYGHAGFFWINNGKVFDFLDIFKNSKDFKALKREVLIDDYFKFLVKYNKINSAYFLLKNYVHLGSIKEYKEYLYWKEYFN